MSAAFNLPRGRLLVRRRANSRPFCPLIFNSLPPASIAGAGGIVGGRQMSRMLTTAEVAEALRVTTKGLLKARAEGRLPIRPVRVGLKLLWRERDVEQLLDGATQPDPAAA